MRKSILDISWQVDEPTYRAHPAISYSTLSTFAREGHRCIPTLFDKKDSEALRFGGLVDTILTEPERVSEKFFIADFPSVSDTIMRMVKRAFTLYGDKYRGLDKIPFNDLLGVVNSEGYYANWKDETRVKDVITKGSDFYSLLYLAGDKPVMSHYDYEKAQACVDTLRTHPFTKDILAINPFEDHIEKVFQAKFLLESPGLPRSVRCMFDFLVVDHKNKTVQPFDFKTTGKNESDFEKSVLDWRYDLQATLYSQILKHLMSLDKYFKDFELLPFTFLVINRENLTPMFWVFRDHLVCGNWVSSDGKVYEGWLNILMRLSWHLSTGVFQYPMDAYMNNGFSFISNLSACEY